MKNVPSSTKFLKGAKTPTKKSAAKKHRVKLKPASTGRVAMSFAGALYQAIEGKAKISRYGWNGKDMFIVHIPGSKVQLTGSPYAKLFPKRKTMDIGGHFDMFTAQRTMQPGWLASQADMLANDWFIVK